VRKRQAATASPNRVLIASRDGIFALLCMRKRHYGKSSPPEPVEPGVSGDPHHALAIHQDFPCRIGAEFLIRSKVLSWLPVIRGRCRPVFDIAESSDSIVCHGPESAVRSKREITERNRRGFAVLS